MAAHRIFWLGLYGLILAAWGGVWAMDRGLSAWRGLPPDLWRTLCEGAANAAIGPLLAMWALMVAAMMLPSALPAIRTYLELPVERFGTALVAGYLAVWAGAAVLGAGAQSLLARAGLLDGTGASLSAWLTGALLIGAGLYQFSAFKAACLAKCRMPLTRFMELWAPGRSAALRMGLRMGADCLGCCWALMALAFVGGTMNLMWMGAATLLMTLEKLPGPGRHLTAPVGVALVAGGIWALIKEGQWLI